MTKRPEEELQELRRCLRDVVALSALPSVWTGYDTARIAQQFGEVIGRTLAADAVFVRALGSESTWIAPGVDDTSALLRDAAAAPLRSEARAGSLNLLS